MQGRYGLKLKSENVELGWRCRAGVGEVGWRMGRRYSHQKGKPQVPGRGVFPFRGDGAQGNHGSCPAGAHTAGGPLWPSPIWAGWSKRLGVAGRVTGPNPSLGSCVQRTQLNRKALIQDKQRSPRLGQKKKKKNFWNIPPGSRSVKAVQGQHSKFSVVGALMQRSNLAFPARRSGEGGGA